MLDFYSTPIVGTPVFLYSGQIAVPEPNIIGVTVSLLVFSPCVRDQWRVSHAEDTIWSD